MAKVKTGLEPETQVVEGLEIVTENVDPASPDPQTEAERLAAEQAAAQAFADAIARDAGNFPTTNPIEGGDPSEGLGPTDVSPVLEHKVARKRRFDKDNVLRGEGPLVDGCRYNVIVRQEGEDVYTPLYVTDAMTGERLPTTCGALVKKGKRWFAQMSSRVGGEYRAHQGLDPVEIIVVPSGE